MKTIHLACGHNIQVSRWPSAAGMAKVRQHYKRYHPKRMKAMTKKSLRTKRKRGLINPKLKSYGHSSMSQYFSYLDDISQDVKGIHDKEFLDTALASHLRGRFKISSAEAKGVVAAWRRRGLVNPKTRKLPRRQSPLRMLSKAEKNYLDKTVGKGWGLMPKSTIMRILKRKRNPCKNPLGQKWIILWKDGGRMGSVGLTKKNLAELRRQFSLRLIQKDLAGHEHYDVVAVKKAGKRAGTIKNPCRLWYVGFPRGGRLGKLFQSSRKPTKASHGRQYRSVTGPFNDQQAAMKYRNEMSGA